jgi:hypothetical protein
LTIHKIYIATPSQDILQNLEIIFAGDVTSDDVPKGITISSGMTATVVVEAPPRQWAALAALRGAGL